MKKILSLIGVVLFQTLPLFGAVKFNFVYADKPGTGFHIWPEARNALEEVGQLIGGNWLKHHDAQIVVKVVSNKTSIGQTMEYFAGVRQIENQNSMNKKYQHTYLGKKIILRQKNNDKKFDTHLTVDLQPNYSFKDKVGPNEYDFKAVIIHELTHSLGLISKNTKFIQGCPNTPEEVLEENLEKCIQKLFQFGINEIEGNPQTINSNELRKELNFYESMNIDIDQIVWERIDSFSNIDLYEALLNKTFKESLQTKTLSENRFELYAELCKVLAKNGITVEEFIQFKSNRANLFFDAFEFGIKKLMNRVIDKNQEAKLKKHFMLQIQLSGSLKEVSEYLLDGEVGVIFEVLLFCEKYFKGEIIPKNEMGRIVTSVKKNAQSLGMTIDEYSQFININKRATGYTYFDQFVVNKKGEKFFNQQTDKHLIDYCFPKKGSRGEELYFKGPNVLKYMGSQIPLNGLDVSHISKRKESIMNPILDGPGLKSREWDANVTAIMLDLGYKVDNYWTRLWKVNEEDKNKAKKNVMKPKKQSKKIAKKLNMKAKKQQNKAGLKEKAKKSENEKA